MNIIFLTLVEIGSVEEHGIYQDLLRKFRDEGHDITVISPAQRRRKIETNIKEKEGVTILQVKTLNIQKTNIVEKGIGTLLIEYQYLAAIKKHFPNKKFDLVLYSTPPITFSKIISYIKQRDNAKSYLLLKDIFPQNAVDMKMMSATGIMYRFFRKKEKELYHISDTIGCMSPANKKYVLDHNPEIKNSTVEVNPNSIEAQIFTKPTQDQISDIRAKYVLPLDKKILIYGGNLGIPQGLDFLLETIVKAKDYSKLFFLIVGTGTEYEKIKNWFATHNPANAKLLSGLPKMEYDELIKVCDIGLIFLNKDFTIPNFPSRLLSYLEYKLPVLVAADANTDIGTEVEKNHCGVSVIAGNTAEMDKALQYFTTITDEDFDILRQNARKYLEKSFLVSDSYEKIMKRVLQNNNS